MSSERFARVKAILAQAYELPREQRDAFVREACGDDAELLAEVLSLLAEDAREGDTFEGMSPSTSDVLDAFGAEEPELPLPEFVGHYRVLRLIARGGMGAVYEAEQDTPQRRVALKMLRTELVTRTLLQRFRRESEILGRLQHAGIAQVYEAGTTLDAGVEQPFFAMEYVDGRPLTAYAAEHALSRDARLALFARVCDAVDHAHGKGVVHRDLKPDNVLVTPSGEPKVLDFGVARSTAFDLGAATLHTEVGQLIGTLAYMSPEQVRGDPEQVDVRSDVYALGVMLYELLAGERPFDVTRRSVTEAVRVIQEQEAVRLGKRITACRGDLETIVGKALEKDRLRRYDDAGALAADVRAHLRHEPITARPPSAAYRARKFARRHRGLVAGTLLGGAALLVGLIVAVRFGLDEARQRMASEFVTYQTVLESADTLLEQHDPREAARRLERAPEALRGWEWRHLSARLDDALWSADVALVRPRDTLIPMPGNTVDRLVAQGVAFSDDGERVLSWLDARTLGVWASADGQLLARHELDAEMFVEVLALHGSRVALATEDGRLLVVDIESGARLHEETLPRRAQAVAWHPDGRQLVVGVQHGGAEPEIRFELLRGEPGALRALHTRAGTLAELVWLNGGAWLAVSWDESPLRGNPGYRRLLLDAESGAVLQLYDELNPVGALAAVPSERALYVGSSHRWLRRYADASVDEAVSAHGGHANQVIVDMALAPSADMAASLDRGALRVWRLSTGDTLEVQLTRGGFTGSVALEARGRYAAVALPDRLRVWRMGDGFTRVLRGHDAAVYWLALGADGRTLASFDFAARTHVWDLATDEERARFPTPEWISSPPYHMVDTEVGLDVDGTRWLLQRGAVLGEADLATDTALRRVDTNDPATPLRELHALDRTQRLRLWLEHARGPSDAQHFVFSPDGARVLDTLFGELRDTASLEVVRRLQPGPWPGADWIQLGATASFAPDGARIVVTWAEPDVERSTAHVYDTRTGERLVTLDGEHVGAVFAVAWSPDGTRLASGGDDGAVVLWDAQSYAPLVRLSVHTSYVHDLLWTPDGSALVSASGDGDVHVWDSVPRAERTAAARATRLALEVDVPEGR